MFACTHALAGEGKLEAVRTKPIERKRDGFVPLGDVAGTVELPSGHGLPPRPATLQARHHFTSLDQIDQPR